MDRHREQSESILFVFPRMSVYLTLGCIYCSSDGHYCKLMLSIINKIVRKKESYLLFTCYCGNVISVFTTVYTDTDPCDSRKNIRNFSLL